MKVLLQRVSRSSVSIGGEIVGSTGRGLVALVGVIKGDTEADVRYLVDKTVHLRIFEDNDGKFNLSLLDVKGELLVVSQFTLAADTRKGRRPSFIDAALPEAAGPLVDKFVSEIRACDINVATGQFGAHMLVDIHNDGPVTILLDSREHLKGI